MKILEAFLLMHRPILLFLARFCRCNRRNEDPEENKPVLTDNEKKELNNVTKERRQNQRLIENM
jgi:hypothetical protein